MRGCDRPLLSHAGAIVLGRAAAEAEEEREVGVMLGKARPQAAVASVGRCVRNRARTTLHVNAHMCIASARSGISWAAVRTAVLAVSVVHTAAQAACHLHTHPAPPPAARGLLSGSAEQQERRRVRMGLAWPAPAARCCKCATARAGGGPARDGHSAAHPIVCACLPSACTLGSSLKRG